MNIHIDLIEKIGGVSVFIKANAMYKRREDLEFNNDCIESVIIEMDKSYTQMKKNVIAAVIYRPPNTDITLFNASMDQLLSVIKRENKASSVMGDFNINLLNTDNHLGSSEFLNCMYSYSFFPLINRPTRITNQTATLIDNIFCNIAQNSVLDGILLTDISDHLPIFCITANEINISAEENFYSRTYNDTNVNKFKAMLHDIDWNLVKEINDCQKAYTVFHNKFKLCYDKCFPLVRKKQGYKNRKPWLTSGLKLSIKVKNRMYVRSLKCPTLTNVKLYREYRNKLHGILRRAEREHYDKLLVTNKNNLSKTWKILKEVINKKKSDFKTSSFVIKEPTVTDCNIIAESFNDFYVNIGASLAKKIPNVEGESPESYVKHNPHSIFLKPTDTNEITTVVHALKNCSPGYDDVKPLIIKQSLPLFIEPLVHIFNLSMLQGSVPRELKQAKVIPLYKKGDPMHIVNYRPVSLLPAFSKILEKLLYNRIFEFIVKHDLLYKFQFGFRRKHNTSMALITITDKIMHSLDNGDYVIGIFLDFSKAFDTVNHSILLRKLYNYGIRGVAHKWCECYLNERAQYVQYNNTNSTCKPISCGVPQGSILGPLLFLLYINDMVHVSSILLPILFADDTNMFITGNDLTEMSRTVNSEMEKLVYWLNINKLSLNVSKTHYIIFSSKKRQPSFESVRLTINNIVIDRVSSTRFLGVLMDEKLNWHEHITMIRNKIAKGIGLLSRARKVLNVSSLITLYNSLILPYLMYCIEVWGSAKALDLQMLIKLQKRALRIISSVNYRAHTHDLFVKHKILKLPQIYMLCVLCFMFKFYKNMLPSVFNSLFSMNVNVYNTRQENNLYVPRGKTAAIYNTIRFKGVHMWNLYHKEIGISCTLFTFKRNLKTLLINNSIQTS